MSIAKKKKVRIAKSLITNVEHSIKGKHHFSLTFNLSFIEDLTSSKHHKENLKVSIDENKGDERN